MLPPSPVRALYGIKLSTCIMLGWLCGCASDVSAGDFPRTPSYTIPVSQTANTLLGQDVRSQSQGHPGQSGFHLILRGDEAFLSRIALIEMAQKSIDLQYYSTRDDSTGKLLLESITRAADRGVRIRLLLDDWNLKGFDSAMEVLAAHPHIEIRIFNPVSTGSHTFLARTEGMIMHSGKVGRRMHNKALIVDDQMVIMGGRNLGDEYFEASPDFNFRDVDVLASGPVVNQISLSFDKYWNSDEAYPLAAIHLPKRTPEDLAKIQTALDNYWTQMENQKGSQFLENAPLVQQVKAKKVSFIWGTAQLAADSPRKVDRPSASAVSRPEILIDALAAKARHEFIIITPYFVPLESGSAWLEELVRRGVAVDVLTNSLSSTDVVMVHSAYSHYREALIKDGVTIYELKAMGGHPHHMFRGSSSQSSLHTKIYVIDRSNVVIGSYNMDPRSEQFNTEQVLVIQSPELGDEVAKLYERATSPEISYHVVMSNDPNNSDASAPPYLIRSHETAPYAPSQHGHLLWITQLNGKTVTFNDEPDVNIGRRITNDIFTLLPFDDHL